MPSRAARVCTAESVSAYRRDGAVVLRGLLSHAEVETLRSGVNKNLAAPTPRGLVASGPADPGRFFEDFRIYPEVCACVLLDHRVSEMPSRWVVWASCARVCMFVCVCVSVPCSGGVRGRQ